MLTFIAQYLIQINGSGGVKINIIYYICKDISGFVKILDSSN